jgi:hypothetical protein
LAAEKKKAKDRQSDRHLNAGSLCAAAQESTVMSRPKFRVTARAPLSTSDPQLAICFFPFFSFLFYEIWHVRRSGLALLQQ